MHLEVSVEVQTRPLLHTYRIWSDNGTNSAMLIICCQTTKVGHVYVMVSLKLACSLIYETPVDISIWWNISTVPFKIDKLNQEKIVSDFANLAGQIRIRL